MPARLWSADLRNRTSPSELFRQAASRRYKVMDRSIYQARWLLTPVFLLSFGMVIINAVFG
jgi:hypothetical protein